MPEICFPGNDYDTADGAATPFASRFPFLFFCWKVLAVIRHDGNLALAGNYSGREWCEGSLNTLRALEQCGVRISVRGMEVMDRVDGPCVFIGNHMSTLETFVLPVLIQPRKPVTYVVKESLIKYPWFGPVLRSRDPIVVTRANARKDFAAVLDGGQERLRQGVSIIVFPQSTRSDTLDLEQFNSIGIKLAKKSGVPVIPLALRTDAWGRSALIKDFGRINPALPVRFAFGEPLAVSGNGKAEHLAVCRFIAGKLREWGLEAPELPQG